jgi:endonuclease/exonuclease/phosphatase family metal-dependent hydrolase
MATIRIATFNVENMLVRFKFDPATEAGLATLLDIDGPEARSQLARSYWNMINDEMRTLTALAIRQCAADVVCLQEIESVRALAAFHDRYLRRIGDIDYEHRILIEGNDKRGIDVAALSRFPFDRIATHQELTYSQLRIEKPKGDMAERVFRRDCLELHVQCGDKQLPVFVAHFKSMTPTREKSRAVRECEARAVRHVIEQRFADPAAADWLLVGDLNDYTETDGAPNADHALAPLVADGFAVDAIKRIADPRDRWTHFYPDERSYHQLDYILLSPALARRNKDAVPQIVRNGLPYRAERYAGPRYPRIGWDRPKASDHCPVVMEVRF